jgi:hypothetical protein
MAGEILRVTGGNAAGTEIGLDEELLIGRSADEGSLKDDPELSREHAKITRTGEGELLIEDLGSTNGTFVNGERITQATAIRSGDKIEVGITTLEVALTIQPTAIRPVATPPPPADATRAVEPPAAPPPAAPPPAAAPPETPGPPPGVAGGPPPGVAGGPPPGVAGGPPPGTAGGPPGTGGGPPSGMGMPPAIKARIRKMAILAAGGGFLVGFGIAAAIFNLL